MKMKTDIGHIEYPEGLSGSDRRHIRSMVIAVAEHLKQHDVAVVLCSGGIDSTVLAHATGQAMNIIGRYKCRTTAVYLNHNLRPEAVEAEAYHVETLTLRYLSYVTPSILLDVHHGKGLQERARAARYEAATKLVDGLHKALNKSRIAVFTAHNMCDDAETKLFQFVRGMKEQPGIPSVRQFGHATLCRPFLAFSRKDIERYAACFNLSWCEDSSNAGNKYTRNKIRHFLLPWIEENMNPGVVRMLSKMTVNKK